MINGGLLSYFLVSYSIGLASLVVALASWLRRRTRPARDFLLSSLVMAVIGASTLVMNLVNAGGAPLLITLLRLVNYTGAAVFIFVLPLLIHSVYKTALSHILNMCFLLLACLTSAAAIALTTYGMTVAADRLLLGVKDLSLIHI